MLADVLLSDVWRALQVAYHSGDIEGMASKYANPPVSVKEDLGAVMDAIKKRFSSM